MSFLKKDVLVDKFTGTGEVDETYLDTGAVDEKDLSRITRGKLPLN